MDRIELFNKYMMKMKYFTIIFLAYNTFLKSIIRNNLMTAFISFKLILKIFFKVLRNRNMQ